jgi:hypothetical protein
VQKVGQGSTVRSDRSRLGLGAASLVLAVLWPPFGIVAFGANGWFFLETVRAGHRRLVFAVMAVLGLLIVAWLTLVLGVHTGSSGGVLR